MKIILNGALQEIPIVTEQISYEDILGLLDRRGALLTVTYHIRGEGGGELIPGQSTDLIDGMIINASHTNNA